MSAEEIRKIINLLESIDSPLDLTSVTNQNNTDGEHNIGRRVSVPRPLYAIEQSKVPLLGRISEYRGIGKYGRPVYKVTFDTPIKVKNDRGYQYDTESYWYSRSNEEPAEKELASYYYSLNDIKFVD